MYLPSREACDYYISRFLEDVHCTHWFYSIENFLARVDGTYSTSGFAGSDSWLCSLYAIFAVGSSGCGETDDSSASPVGDSKTSKDYIALAKQLIPAVYDEADIDSIRALAILVST